MIRWWRYRCLHKRCLRRAQPWSVYCATHGGELHATLAEPEATVYGGGWR